MTETKAKQEGYQYNDCFPSRERAKRRADKYKEMGFDAKIIKASYTSEYRVYVKKEV